LDSGEKKDLDLSDSGGKEESDPSGMTERSRGSVVAALGYPMDFVVATPA